MTRETRDAVQHAIMQDAVENDWNKARDRLRRRRMIDRILIIAVALFVAAASLSALWVIGGN